MLHWAWKVIEAEGQVENTGPELLPSKGVRGGLRCWPIQGEAEECKREGAVPRTCSTGKICSRSLTYLQQYAAPARCLEAAGPGLKCARARTGRGVAVQSTGGFCKQIFTIDGTMQYYNGII